MVPVTILEPAVKSYIVCSGILALKVLGMSVLTGRMRFKKNVFANAEDAKTKGSVVKFDDPDVERIRRAHLNDLENIPVFWVLGALYLTTNPSAELAVTLFRVYTAGRVLHTVVYAIKTLPQPARGICFGVPYFISMYMGATVVTTRRDMGPLLIAEPAVRSYILYSSILALKVLLMAILTGRVRYTKMIFANEEDASIVNGKVKLDDPDVERVLRAHLNDLENIPAFWLLGALYLTTGPASGFATTLFRWYTGCRIAYTFVYAVKPVPQPVRGIVHAIPFLINCYMGFQTIAHYITAL